MTDVNIEEPDLGSLTVQAARPRFVVYKRAQNAVAAGAERIAANR